MKATRIALGIAALCVAGLTACTVPAPVPAPAPIPAPAVPPAAPPAGQGAVAPVAPVTVAPQVAQSLGQRSSEGGYWPVSVQLGQHSQLGPIVIDGQGYTLYRFDEDEAHPSRATCSGSCATQWPPVLANQGITFQNLDPSLISTVQRADGTQQVTLGGWPVYRYINDIVPGQATGQGAGGTWFVVGADGSKAAGGRHIN
jgi:predicted lipoprotein with Yx(FWY)xxD motif